jgi:hypothetical protein
MVRIIGSLLISMYLGACVSMPPIQNTTDLSSVDFSNVKSFKRGESCTTFLFGAIPFGSTRITGAVRDGNIKSLKIVEYETRNYLIVTQFCLLAYGV